MTTLWSVLRSLGHAFRQSPLRGAAFGGKTFAQKLTRLAAVAWLAMPLTSRLADSAEITDQSSATPAITVDVVAEPVDPRLPADIPAKITIRYYSNNIAARQRAIELSRGLSEQGLDVADVVATSERIAANAVSYFYAEDKPGAEIAARGLGSEWTLTQRRIAPREAMPRPGALELAVAGP